MPAEPKMQVQMQSEADAKMVDLPTEGDTTEVKLDEVPKKVNADDTTQEVDVGVKEADGATSDEVDDYGKKVQSRIDKLTKRAREAERREQAAVQYAQGVQRDAEQIKHRAQQIDSGYVAEYAFEPVISNARAPSLSGLVKLASVISIAFKLLNEPDKLGSKSTSAQDTELESAVTVIGADIASFIEYPNLPAP